MTATVWNGEASDRQNSLAVAALSFAAQCWFVVAVLGQWMFAAFIALSYGLAQRMPHAHVPGDTWSNVAIGAHLILGAIAVVGGPLQFIPQIRRIAPSFHRWNGRVYMLTMFVVSLAGLHMTWHPPNGVVGDFVHHLGVSGDAILIIAFAILALRYAMARDFRTHRRWALRLFIVGNGVWFDRIGSPMWTFFMDLAGIDPKFRTVWSFVEYLLPLAILELYLRAKDRAGASGRLAVATVLLVSTVVTGVGIYLAVTRTWLPRII